MYKKYRRRGSFTPSKKIEILSKRYHDLGFDERPVYREPVESPLGDANLTRDFPLVLSTGAKLSCYVHSQMRNIPSLRRRMPHNVAEMNSDTAMQYQVSCKDYGQDNTKGGAVIPRVRRCQC
jgi:anaerobic selenocysteine-containing dehydrogenase